MRTYPQKLLDFWDDMDIWNQYGIAAVSSIAALVLFLEIYGVVYAI